MERSLYFQSPGMTRLPSSRQGGQRSEGKPLERGGVVTIHRGRLAVRIRSQVFRLGILTSFWRFPILHRAQEAARHHDHPGDASGDSVIPMIIMASW